MSLSERLSERFLESTAEVRDQASAYVNRAADAARATADLAAGSIAAARTPIEVLTGASLQFNSLSHDYLARLLRRQAAMLNSTVSEGERRLQRLARAQSLQEALASQAEDLNDLPQRLARKARETWDIVADAGRGVAELGSYTLAGLAQPAAAPKKTRKASTARPAVAARKPAAAPRAKAAARKSAAPRRAKAARTA
jgi:phasin family protein